MNALKDFLQLRQQWVKAIFYTLEIWFVAAFAFMTVDSVFGSGRLLFPRYLLTLTENLFGIVLGISFWLLVLCLPAFFFVNRRMGWIALFTCLVFLLFFLPAA